MLLQLMHSIVANDFLTHLVMPAQIYAHIFNNREHQATPAIEWTYYYPLSYLDSPQNLHIYCAQ